MSNRQRRWLACALISLTMALIFLISRPIVWGVGWRMSLSQILYGSYSALGNRRRRLLRRSTTES